MTDQVQRSWWRTLGASIAGAVGSTFGAAGALGRSVLPAPRCKTDRVVRWLLLLDIILLVLLTRWAYEPLVVFTAIIAGNAVGAIGGLLFAVPRRDRDVKRAISGNTSLEDVSDWLTKTIIGAGLVSWASILNRLDQAGYFVGLALSPDDYELATAGGVAMILASSGLGAIIGYLWFARHWPSELAGADAEVDDIVKKTAAQGLSQETRDVAPPTPNLPPPDEHDAGGAGAAPPADGGESPPIDGQAGAPPDGAPAGDEQGDADGREQLAPPAMPGAPVPSAATLLRTKAAEKYALMRTAPKVPHDWAKGMFGGAARRSTAASTRELTATVRQLDSRWYEIVLEVTASPAPETEVIFFLHNTFKNPTPSAGFAAGGVARLVVTAYGAFTVGALCDDGSTELELDLAELSTAPIEFRNR